MSTYVITDLKPAYRDFEKLVNSSLNIPNATSIVKYRLTAAAGKAKYNRIFNPVLYRSWNQVMPFESQLNQNPPLVGNIYELDCWFIPSTWSSLFDLFKDVFARRTSSVRTMDFLNLKKLLLIQMKVCTLKVCTQEHRQCERWIS